MQLQLLMQLDSSFIYTEMAARRRFELLCRAICRNSLAATRPRSDFIYTEMAARRRFDFIYTEMAAPPKIVGDDASKNGDFERVKQRLQGYKKF